MKKFVIFVVSSFVLFLISDFSSKNLEVVDGDTIKIDGRKVRLWGIDAPEIKQVCIVDGIDYYCGVAAKNFLVELLDGQSVDCVKINEDRYKRIVARCFIKDYGVTGEYDIGSLMVRNGWAVDYKQYSKGAYAEYQKQAKNDGLGLWQGTFVMPKDWRKGVR